MRVQNDTSGGGGVDESNCGVAESDCGVAESDCGVVESSIDGDDSSPISGMDAVSKFSAPTAFESRKSVPASPLDKPPVSPPSGPPAKVEEGDTDLRGTLAVGIPGSGPSTPPFVSR